LVTKPRAQNDLLGKRAAESCILELSSKKTTLPEWWENPVVKTVGG